MKNTLNSIGADSAALNTIENWLQSSVQSSHYTLQCTMYIPITRYSRIE